MGLASSISEIDFEVFYKDVSTLPKQAITADQLEPVNAFGKVLCPKQMGHVGFAPAIIS